MVTRSEDTSADRRARLMTSQAGPPPASGAGIGRHAPAVASLRDTAVWYAERGMAVVPLRPATSGPPCPATGPTAATAPTRDAGTGTPGGNRGPPPTRPASPAPGRGRRTTSASLPSRLVVIDADTHGELPADWAELGGIADGRDVLAQLCDWAGQQLPTETYWTVTPSGGWHLYFRAPPGRVIRSSAWSWPR